jgi:hypothetical protein
MNGFPHLSFLLGRAIFGKVYHRQKIISTEPYAERIGLYPIPPPGRQNQDTAQNTVFF